MLLIPKHESQLVRLADKLRLAEAPTPDLVAEIFSACTRIPSLSKSRATAVKFDQLAKMSAWTDLAIALIGLELPGWNFVASSTKTAHGSARCLRNLTCRWYWTILLMQATKICRWRSSARLSTHAAGILHAKSSFRRCRRSGPRKVMSFAATTSPDVSASNADCGRNRILHRFRTTVLAGLE